MEYLLDLVFVLGSFAMAAYMLWYGIGALRTGYADNTTGDLEHGILKWILGSPDRYARRRMPVRYWLHVILCLLIGLLFLAGGLYLAYDMVALGGD